MNSRNICEIGDCRENQALQERRTAQQGLTL
jgi:hypothetical protein